MSRLPRNLLVLLLLAGAMAPGALRAASYATSDGGSGGRSDAYRDGQSALEDEEWDEASRIFGKLAARAGDEADAALYWKAYADWKLQRKKETVEGLRKLLSTYPESAWADDARALEVEVRGGKASKKSTESDDEELKLYALDGLMQVDSEKAVPVLERLLAGSSSRRIKERALFVLSQSDSPRAREILIRVAKTGQPIEMRSEAVKTLGIAGEPEDLAALATIARDKDAPPEVRDAVIQAYLISGREGELVAIARTDPDSRIRAKAIEALGAIGALPSLRQLWGTEKDPELRAKLLEAFGIAGDVGALAKAARDTSDPQLRRKAIEGLAISGSDEAGEELREMYREFSDPGDKRKIVEAFMILGDAKTLIELFRAEKDPSLKKVILQQLSVMDDPEATRVILEVLGE